MEAVMPFETAVVVAAVVIAFGVFGLALGYVDMIAGARAITIEEERALRRK
jgi:multisubunit Na+/H+ antiporter MnhC subunit